MELIARSLRHSPSSLRYLAAGLAALLVLVGGVAEAAHRYDEGRADTLLSGVTIGGFDVGGMTTTEARTLLERTHEAPLDAPLTIRLADRTLVTTFREVGAETDIDEKLQAARGYQDDLGFFSRLYHRLTGSAVDGEFTIDRRLDPARTRAALDELATDVESAPENSTVDVSSGFVEITRARPGRAIDRDEAVAVLGGALERGMASVALPGEPVPPAVTENDHGTILLVRTGENKLYHYENARLVKEYRVATGMSGHETPTGRWEVTLKRRNPTWVNPAKSPGDWGWSMPARIGPGPSNPLGTRALNLNASGIRIHGTSNTGSIGYNASHGCIRMVRTDVEELFERVGVGSSVYVVDAGPPRRPGTPLPDDAPRAEGA